MSAKDAASRRDHIAVPCELPLPLDNGFRMLPEDARAGVRIIMERAASRVKDVGRGQLVKLTGGAKVLMSELFAGRKGVRVGRYSAWARFHIPCLAELFDGHNERGADGSSKVSRC